MDVGIDVLRTVLSKTGVLLAQLGSVTSERTETDDAEWWQHVGFISRPPKATPKQDACQAVRVRRGDRDVIVASRDLRGIELAGNVADGETCIYAPGEDGKAQARVILKKDGSMALFTSDDNTQAGNSVYFRVAPDAMEFVAPWGRLTFDAKGFNVVHSSGARLKLGAIGGLPAPLDKFTSYAQLQAAMVDIKGGIVSAGGAEAEPGVKSLALIAYLQQLEKFVLSLVPAISAAGPGGPAAVGALSIPSTALETATEALPETIQSSVAIG